MPSGRRRSGPGPAPRRGSRGARWSVGEAVHQRATSPTRRASRRTDDTAREKLRASLARPLARSRISPPAACTEPPGRSSDEPRTAATTASKERPWRSSASSETSIAISSGRTEASETSEISGSAASSSRACSARRFSVRSSASPERRSRARGAGTPPAPLAAAPLLGQLSIASDARADLGHAPRHVLAGVQLDRDARHALRRRRAHALHAREACTASSMRVASASSTSPGRGARVGRRDGHDLEVEVREHLRRSVGQASTPPISISQSAGSWRRGCGRTTRSRRSRGRLSATGRACPRRSCSARARRRVRRPRGRR